MGEHLIYALLFSSILNTIFLLVLSIILVKFFVVASRLVTKIELLLNRGEEEIFSTITALKKTIDHTGYFFKKTGQFVEKYLIFAGLKKLAHGSKLSKVASGVSVGYGLIKFLKRFLEKKK